MQDWLLGAGGHGERQVGSGLRWEMVQTTCSPEAELSTALQADGTRQYLQGYHLSCPHLTILYTRARNVPVCLRTSRANALESDLLKKMYLCIYVFIHFWPHHAACEILIPQRGLTLALGSEGPES